MTVVVPITNIANKMKYFLTAYWCSKAPEVPVFAYQTWRAARPRYEHGERIYYSCKAGFIMVGTPVRVCTLGQWSAVKFNCSGKCTVEWSREAVRRGS